MSNQGQNPNVKVTMMQGILQPEEQLSTLPTMSKEEILAFFSKDLSSIPHGKIIGNLKMAIMFMDPVVARDLKRAILNVLSSKSRDLGELVSYLEKPIADEIRASIPIWEQAREPIQNQPVTIVAESPMPIVMPNTPPQGDHFDAEDMAEIEQFQGGKTAFQPHSFTYELQKVWDVLPRDARGELEKDIALKRRLESVVVTYLKDIRDELETRQRLVAEREIGGLGFTHGLAEAIFAVLKIASEDKNKQPMTEEETTKEKQEVKEEKADKKEALEEKEEVKEDHREILPIVAPPHALLSSSLEPIDMGQIAKQTKLPPATLEVKKLKVPQPPNDAPSNTVTPNFLVSAVEQSIPHGDFSTPRRGAPGGKAAQKMGDILYPGKGEKDEKGVHAPLIGPTEEFSALTREDLRRETTCAEFVDKIARRIADLSKDNYLHKIESVRAWKRSPLYREYLNVGQRSLENQESVPAYLASVSNAGGLTYEEFEAIGELNKKLRF